MNLYFGCLNLYCCTLVPVNNVLSSRVHV